MRQPETADPNWPRYSRVAFPAYRFIPRLTPHPYRDPDGHSYGQAMPSAAAIEPTRWRESEDFLFGIDCFNFAYWWESHEILEEIWHAVGHTSEQGQFLQGVIQIAAGYLHQFSGRAEPANRQIEAGLRRLSAIPDHYMGVNVREFSSTVRATFHHEPHTYPLIKLE